MLLIELQLPLERFPDSNFQRLFSNPQLVDAKKKASSHQKFAPISMDRQLPDGDWSTRPES